MSRATQRSTPGPTPGPSGNAAAEPDASKSAAIAASSDRLALEHAQQLSHLSHELSNALEIVLQSSYLLGSLAGEEQSQQWRGLLDKGIQQAVAVNQQMRDYIRKNS